MGKLDFIIGGDIADFKGNALLIKAADFLEGKIDGIDGLPDELKSGFGALVAAFKDEGTPEAVKTAIIGELQELGSNLVDEIEERVVAFVEKAGIPVPDDWKEFTKKVGDFAGSNTEFDWSLFDLKGSKNFSKNEDHSILLSGSASASLNLGAGVSLPETYKKAVAEIGTAATIPESNLVALGMEGKLGGKLALSLPKIGMDSSADRSLDLDYYFNATPDERLAAAFARSFDNIVSPFDLKGINDNDRLAAVRYHQKNGFKFGMSFALKKGFDFFGADIGVGLTVAASVLRQGATEMVTWRNGGKVYVSLERSRKRTDTSTVGLAVGIDLSKLVGDVNEILKEVQGEYQKVLAEFDEFTKPGAIIKAKISDAWKNIEVLTDDQKGLVLSLIGFEGGESAEEALTNLIEAKILTHKNALDKDIDDAVEDITDSVFSALGIDKAKQPELVEKVEKLLDDGLEDIHKALIGRIAELIDGTGADEFLQNLGKVATGVADAADDLDKKLKKTLNPVRNILQKYYDGLGQIVKITGDKKAAQLKMEFAREEIKATGDEADLIIEFSEFTDAHAEAYKALTRGSFDEVHRLVRFGLPGISISGRFASFVQNKITHSFRLSFLGFDLGSTSIIDAITELEIDANGSDGSVMVTSKSQLDKHFDPLISKEARKLRITSLMILAASAQHPNLRSTFRLWHQDKSMKRKEVTGFLGSLLDEDLILEEKYNGLVADYDAHVKATGDKKPEGQITAGYDLERKHMTALLRLGNQAELADLKDTYKTVVARNYAEIVLGQKKCRNAVNAIRQVYPSLASGHSVVGAAAIDAMVAAIAEMNDSLYDEMDAKLGDGRMVRATNRPLWNAYWANKWHNLIDAFWEILVVMHSVYFRGKNLNISSNRKSELAWFNDQQVKLAKLHSRWLKVNKGLFSIPREIRPETIAFIESLLALIDQGGAVKPDVIAALSFEPVDD